MGPVRLCLENADWANSVHFGGHKVHKSGQVLYDGRDGRATKPSWHGRLAHEGLGGTSCLALAHCAGTVHSR